MKPQSHKASLSATSGLGLGGNSAASHCGLNGDLPFTILVAQSGELTAPQLSIVGEASYHAQDPLIGFNSDS